MVKAADMMIARRADTRARADFATWKMMAKLNGVSGLTPQAQKFLEDYRALLNQMPDDEASETAIRLIYKTYYSEMGGLGSAPDVKPGPVEPVSDNVTAFRRLPPKPKTQAAGPARKSQLPVALIFAGLVVVYVAIRYFWR